MNRSSLENHLVVLPVLNEKKNLEVLLPKIWLLHADLPVLVIDDDSQDGTEAFINELQIQGRPVTYIRRSHKMGIGSAHLKGLEFGIYNNFDFVITMDADLTHRPEDLTKFITLKDSSDLLIGSRYLDDSNMVGWTIFRRSLTTVGHIVTFLAFARNWDMSSGMRKYKTQSIPFGLLNSNCPPDYAFFFTSAITYKRLNLRVSQVPIQLDQRHAGKSKMTFKLMYEGIKLLGLYAFRIKRIKVH